jgi:hypothetical protein
MMERPGEFSGVLGVGAIVRLNRVVERLPKGILKNSGSSRRGEIWDRFRARL